MSKKLLEKLGLKRKKNQPQQQPQPVVNQPPPVVNQQPPVVNQPQQVVQPPPRPVQPPQQGWVAPDRSGRKPQAGPLNPKAQEKQEAFEKTMAAVTPEIRRAKQFALTVDGKRIELAKTDGESKLAKAVTELAGKLTPQIKVIDGHTSIVRQKAEALDFDEAEKELTKAHDVAIDMLLLEIDYQIALLEAGHNVQTSMAGEPSPEQKKYEEEWKEAQITLNSTLALQSDNGAVKSEQKELQKLIGESRQLADKNDHVGASKLLNDAIGNCQVIETLAKAEVEYQTQRSSLQKLASIVRSIDPKSNAGKDRNTALDLWTQSEAAADKGKFADARSLLADFNQLGEKLVPHDDLDARMYPEALANVQPQVKQALAVNVPCQAIIDLKKTLPGMLTDSQSAADERNFKDAYELLEGASVLCNRVAQLEREWEGYFKAEDDAKALLDAVKKLRLTDQKQASEQKSIIADSQRATQDAMAGKLNDANKLLQGAVDRASILISAAASPKAQEYFQEWAEVRATVDEAQAVNLTAKPIVDAKGELAEILDQMNQSVTNNDYEGAIFTLSVVNTRALMVLQLAEKFADYERAEQAFAKQFALAKAADSNLPGVDALQQQLARDLLAARGASATDPAAGKKLLFTALKSANKIVAAAERGQQQVDRSQEMSSVLGDVKKSYLPKGGADNLNGLADGKEFDAVLAAMKAAETDRSSQKLDQLEKSARDWLAVFAKMPEDQQKDQQTERRKQTCETALKQAKHLKMAAKFDSLGNPPWPQDKEDQAADLYVTMMLETGDLPLDNASGGVTGAKWIKSMDFEEGKGKRQFIFKQADAKTNIDGFPEGGEAPREVLGNEVGRQLKAMTGIDFNAPETRIVSIDGGKLPDGKPGTNVAGSAQSAVPCLGTIQELTFDDPEILKQVPPRELQKMAMFDMVSLNMDRHYGNFLVTPPKEGQPPGLVPIDNGLAFPSREGFNARRGKYAGNKAVEHFPQGYEKFDDEMLSAIDALDPDEIVRGMQARLDTMDRENPDLKVKEKVDPESFEMMKNSVEFMKAAAKELSPVFLQDALMSEGEDLLFGTPQERAEKTKEVIERGKANQDAYAPLVNMNSDQKKQYYQLHYDLGWRQDLVEPGWGAWLTAWDAWGRRNAAKIVSIHDKKTPCQELIRANNGLLAEIKQLDPNTTIEGKIQGKTVRDTNDELVSVVKKLREQQKVAAAINQINARFKEDLKFDQLKANQRTNLFDRYQQFVRWGGERMTQIDGQPFKKQPFDAVYNTLAQQIGPQSDHNRMLKLLAHPDFPRMKELVDKYAQKKLLDIKRWSPDEVAEALANFRRFEQLGGMKALADSGFDMERFESGFDRQVVALEVRSQLNDVDA